MANGMIDEQVYQIALAFVEYAEQTFVDLGRQSWFWATKKGERLTCVEHIVDALLGSGL